MSIRSPEERFCYLCDAVTPSQCHCVRTVYCSKCDKEFADREAYRSHDCLQPIVGITKLEQTVTAVAKRNEEEYRRIWNAAIEAVAKHLDEMGEEERISIYVREMKK